MPRRPTGRPRGRPRHPEPVTPAEERVLEQLRLGLTNPEIAARLGVSPDAVKYHVSNMLSKLGLTTRDELAAWVPAPDATVRRIPVVGSLLRWPRTVSRSFARVAVPATGAAVAALLVAGAVTAIVIATNGRSGEDAVTVPGDAAIAVSTVNARSLDPHPNAVAPSFDGTAVDGRPR